MARQRSRLRSDLVTECLRDTPVLSWVLNLPEGGSTAFRDELEEEQRLSALLLRTRESLIAIRGSAIDKAMKDWTEGEIRAAREA